MKRLFMIASIPYINGLMTLTENVFNILGYFPKHQFSKINEWSTKGRVRFGLLQVIIGIALLTFGQFADYLNRKPNPSKYLSLAEQAFSLGVHYVNHGLFNLTRAYIERRGWGCLTGAYDFYGRKILPPLAIPFDLQGHLFERIRLLLNRVHFLTLFPPQFSFREIN